MLTNNSVTIYHRISGDESDTWERCFVPDVWLFNAVKSTITTEGSKVQTNITNSYTLRITDLSVIIAVDDYVVVGEGPENVETVKDFEGYEYFRVSYANYNNHGANPHIKVVGV